MTLPSLRDLGDIIGIEGQSGKDTMCQGDKPSTGKLHSSSKSLWLRLR